jgi:hypothetical protein
MGWNNYTWEEGLRREAACEGGDAGGGARLRTAVSRARSDSSRGCYLLLENSGGAQSEAFPGLAAHLFRMCGGFGRCWQLFCRKLSGVVIEHGRAVWRRRLPAILLGGTAAELQGLQRRL